MESAGATWVWDQLHSEVAPNKVYPFCPSRLLEPEMRVPCVEILVDHGLMVTSTRGTPWPQRSAELPATFLCHLGQKVHKLFINKPNKFRTNKEKGNEGGNKSLNVLKQLPSGKMHFKKKDKKGPRHWVSDYKHLLLQWNLPQRSLPRSAKASKIQEIRTNAMEVLIVHSAQHLQNSRHITASKGPKSGRHRIHKWH